MPSSYISTGDDSIPEEEYDTRKDTSFQYKQTPKTKKFNPDVQEFNQLKGLFDIQTFWQKKNVELIDDLDALIDYIEGVKLTKENLQSNSDDVLKLFEVMQCLLEIKDQDAAQIPDLEADIDDLEKEKKILKEKIDSLERENRNMKTDTSLRLEKLHKREIEDKDAEIAKWRKQYYDKDNLINSITTELESSRMKLRDFEGMEMSLTSKIQQLENEVESLNDIERKIRGRSAEDDSEIEKLEIEIDDLINEKEALKTELEELTDDHLALKDELKLAKQTEDELRKIIKANEREIAERIQVAEERNKDIAKLQDQLDEINEKQEIEIENLRSNLMEDIDRLQHQNEAFQLEIQTKNERIERMTVSFEEEIKKVKIEVGHKASPTIKNLIKDEGVDSPVDEEPNLMQFETDYSTKLEKLQKENESLKETVKELELLLKEENKKTNDDETTDDVSSVSEDLNKSKGKDRSVNQVEEELFRMEEELLLTMKKENDFENRFKGVEGREIQYYREQVWMREKRIEKYRDILNLLLNNFNLIKVELEKLYLKFKVPMNERIDADELGGNADPKLLDEMHSQEIRRLKLEMEESNKRYQNQLKELQDQLRILRASLEDVTDERDELRRLLDEKINEIENLLSEIEELKRPQNDSELDSENYQELYEALLAEYNALKDRLSHGSATSALSEENDLLRRENNALKKRIKELEDELSRLQDQLREAKKLLKEFRDAQGFSGEDEDLIQKLTQQLQIARQQIGILENQCDNEKLSHVSTKKTLVDVQNHKNQLNRDIDDLKIKLNQSMQDCNALRQEIELLKRGLGASPAQGGDGSGKNFTQEALIQVQTENRDLSRQLDDCKDEIAMLLEELNRLKELQENAKLREEEWQNIKDRLQFYESLLNADKDNDKDQSMKTLKQIIAGYNTVINQKEAILARCIGELDLLRKELLLAKKQHQDDIDHYKRLLKKNDTKLIETLQINATTIQNELPLEPGPPVGMALEDVEEIMANKNRAINLLQEEVSSLKNELSEIKKHRDLQIENFSQTRKQLEIENSEQEKKIQDLRLRLEMNKKNQDIPNKFSKDSPSRLQSSQGFENQASQKHIKQLQDERKRASELQNTVESLLSKIEKMKEKHRATLNANSARDLSHLVKKETAEFRTEVRQLREQVSQLSKELIEKQELMEKLQEKNVKQIQQYTQSQKQIEKLASSLSKYKDKSLQYKKELYNMKIGKSGLQEKQSSSLPRKKPPSL